MKITAKTEKIVRGVTVDLKVNEVSQLLFVLFDYKKLKGKKSSKYPFVDELEASLRKARGTGCIIGAKASE